jgi:hypothetical protein
MGIMSRTKRLHNNESLHHENVDDGENDDEEASDLEISDND